jgi:hypothetical protein
MVRSLALTISTAALLLAGVNAQWGYGPFNGGSNGDGCPPWDDTCDGSDDSGSGSDSSGVTSGNQQFDSAFVTDYAHANRILIIHAVLASLVWVLFVPSLAILLRLNLKNPIVLRIHAVGQILSYIIYIVAAGMGVWLARQMEPFGIWDDPHPKLGLAILALAFFQPIVSHTLPSPTNTIRC